MTNDCKKKTTARTTGLTGNQFASVEQGRSYVLSVHSPSGAGEIELLAADSDQQSEPDMFSMLYEKIETARQIPFIAISPFVFVNVGSSDVQWLVTPANFSLAVPGASSGGGSSFDPEAPQEILGDWQFKGELTRTVKASPAANDVLNKEMGDNAYLQLATPTGTGLSVQPSEFRVKVTSSNPLGMQLANTATALGKSNLIIYEDENGSLKKVVPSMGMLYKIPANCTVVSAQQYMYHVQGGSDKVSFSMPSIAEEVTPNSVNITFIQIA